MATIRYLEFLIYANFNLPHCLRLQSPWSRKFRRDRMNGCRDIANFQFPIWRPSAMLNFGNMHILTFRAIYSHNLHVHAKFGRGRLNGCRNIVNFRFPIRQPSAILNCRNMQILTFRTIYSNNLHVLAKFHRDWLNGCGNIANSRFSIWWPSAILNF